MSATVTLELADALLRHPLPVMRGRWPRAVALLARQSLEEALDELWAEVLPGAERASSRAQLLCLPAYLGDEEAAESAAHAWSRLSRACHHRIYELAPGSGELERLLAEVRRLIRAVERRRAKSAP